MQNTPRKGYHMESNIRLTEAGMSSAKPFYYVPELQKMITSGYRMAQEENTSTFTRELVTFFSAFMLRISMTHGRNKHEKIMCWIEKKLRKDDLCVSGLERDGFSNFTLPFNRLQDTDCPPVIEISRYRNFFNYVQKLVVKYHPESLPEWKELVERLYTLAKPVPLRTATVQGSFSNISQYSQIYGINRFKSEYKTHLGRDEKNDLIKEIRRCLAIELKNVLDYFQRIITLDKRDRETDRQELLKTIDSMHYLNFDDARVREKAMTIMARIAEAYDPTRQVVLRFYSKRMDFLDAGLLASASAGNYRPLPKAKGVTEQIPFSFLRGVVEKDILRSLHGIGRDEYGHEKYANGIFIENILKLAQGGVDSDGQCKKAMVLTEAMPRTDKTRVCCGCTRVFCRAKNMAKCGRCKISYYCSRECQKSHWKSGHKEFCMGCDNNHAELRPMHKGIRAIERLVMELGECTKMPDIDMFFKSRLNTFCGENGIKADTFMVLPGAHQSEQGEWVRMNSRLTRRVGSNHLSVVFFKSEDIIRHLNYEFEALMLQIRRHGDSQDGSPDRQTCKKTARGISAQIELLRSKKAGEAFVMGSFDSCALAISKIDTKVQTFVYFEEVPERV